MTEAGERGSERRKGGQRAEAKEGRESGREIRREKEGDDVVFYLFFLRFFFSLQLFSFSLYLSASEREMSNRKRWIMKRKKRLQQMSLNFVHVIIHRGAESLKDSYTEKLFDKRTFPCLNY